MIYGAILASGKGTRVRTTSSVPKQFMKINNIPTIIYTIRNMLKVTRFNYIYLAVPNDYIEYCNNLINEYLKEYEKEKIIIVAGGKERMDSLDNRNGQKSHP